MTHPSLTPETLARLEALEAKASPDNWYWHTWQANTREELIATVTQAVSNTPDPHGPESYSYVYICDEGVNKFTAFSGNGPTSAANAELIAEMRNALPRLLEMAKELHELRRDKDGNVVVTLASLAAEQARTEAAETERDKAEAEVARLQRQVETLQSRDERKICPSCQHTVHRSRDCWVAIGNDDDGRDVMCDCREESEVQP
jgi:RNase P subunit RPR2